MCLIVDHLTSKTKHVDLYSVGNYFRTITSSLSNVLKWANWSNVLSLIIVDQFFSIIS